MTHIILIDPLDNLVIKKDSSLLLALSLQEMGNKVFLLFANDLSITNEGKLPQLPMYTFSGNYKPNDFYIENFTLGSPQRYSIQVNDMLHMRLDPPFDQRYLQTLWLLSCMEDLGLRILNSPKGLLQFNDKLSAYFFEQHGLPSFVGSGWVQLAEFVSRMQMMGHQNFILKPLDQFQGFGVIKVSANDLTEPYLQTYQQKNGKIIICQPFIEEIASGEIRSIFFAGKELATILKVPPAGSYLANIAQGAKFHLTELSDPVRQQCIRMCQQLQRHGILWVAFDILNDQLSEINVSCPGLLVELSHAKKQNLAHDIGSIIASFN